MTRREVSLFLLLTLTLALSQNGEVQQHFVMRAGSDEMIPLCPNDTFLLAWCLIRTETEHGEECRLHYRDNQDFESSCTSRFTLQTHNQTLSLHLSNLTPEDSGTHTCQCSFAVGVQHLHLNLTVIGDPVSTDSLPAGPLVLGIAACSLIILIAGVPLLFVWRKSHQSSALPTPRLSACQTSCSQGLDRVYSTLQNPDRDDYQPWFCAASLTTTNKLADGGAAASETNPGSIIYESI